MTTKKITLSTNKGITEIERGTVVKSRGDLFIVAQVVREQIEDPVHDALFLSNPPKPYRFHQRKIEAKYQLISLTTGSSYFDSQDSLTELLRKIVDNGRFELVNTIEFVEKH